MAAVLVCSNLSQTSAYAQEEIVKENLWQNNTIDVVNMEDSQTEDFEIENGVLIKYKGSGTEVMVPAGVTSIGAYAFKENSNLISVNLPDTVAEIGSGAFLECSNLKKINFPNRLISIGDGAFYDCRSLAEVIFPENLGRIGEEAFYCCWNMSSVIIPGNVDKIADGAFAQCMGLTSVIISEGVEDIGAQAFYRCMDLKTVTIPDSVRSIDVNAFDMIGGLTIYGNEGSYAQTYATEQNISFSLKRETEPEEFEVRDGVLIHYSGKDQRVKIPSEVTSIGDSAFEENQNLISVTIPFGVTSIGNYAFYSCANLNVIDIPSSVTSIGDSVFEECESLHSLYVPSSVTSIGDSAFYSGTANHEITLIVDKGSYAESYAKQEGIDYSYKEDSEEHVHSYIKKITKKAGCTTKGIKTYTCTECDDAYTETVPALGHNYKKKITKATAAQNGVIMITCSRCHNKKTTKIYAVKHITLSKESYIYNGKTRKPSVIVKDSKGKSLKNKKDYTLCYPKGMKKVGFYQITVKFKGNYKGTVKKSFTIAPKATKISKITPISKGFTLQWKKQKTQVTGYEIAFSTSKKFTKKTTKSVTIDKNKTVSRTFSDLKPKKKYYVRIRTYQKAEVNGTTKKICSDWSKVKAVTTKADAAKGIPGFHAQISEKNILKILDRYDKDGAYILRNQIQEGDNILTWFSGANRIIDRIDTAIHEETHGYSYHKDIFDVSSYFIGHGETVDVSHTEIYHTIEMADTIPEDLRTHRYDTYVAKPRENLGSNVRGAYGLLNEFMAYRMGMSTTISLFDYYVDKEAEWEEWQVFIQNCESDKLAYAEFKYYILHYLSFAKEHHPQVYQGIIQNKEFCRAYQKLESSFESLLVTYIKDLKEIQKYFAMRGQKIEIKKDFIWFIQKDGTKTGIGRFNDSLKLKQELKKNTYQSIHKELVANGN